MREFAGISKDDPDIEGEENSVSSWWHWYAPPERGEQSKRGKERGKADQNKCNLS